MVGWHHQLNAHEFCKLWDMVKDREAWCVAVHAVTKTQTRLRDNTRQNLWDAAKAVLRWKYIALIIKRKEYKK